MTRPVTYNCIHGSRQGNPTEVYAGPIHTCECCGLAWGTLNTRPEDGLCQFCHDQAEENDRLGGLKSDPFTSTSPTGGAPYIVPGHELVFGVIKSNSDQRRMTVRVTGTMGERLDALGYLLGVSLNQVWGIALVELLEKYRDRIDAVIKAKDAGHGE